MRSLNKKFALIGAGTLACAGLLIGGSVVAQNITQGAQAETVGKDSPISDVATVDAQTGEKVITDTQAQVVKDLGEAGKLTVEGETKPTFEINVKKVTPVKSCTIRGFGNRVTPDNGTFLIVDVEATLAKSANKQVKEDTAIMPLDATSFGTSAGTGQKISYNLNTEKAYGCEVSKQLDFAVGAGSTVTGQVVLDSKVASGELVYNPDRTGGWTWSF